MDDLCDICQYPIADDDMSAHDGCQAEYDRREKLGLCVRCGLEIEGKATTHQECLGKPYIGYELH